MILDRFPEIKRLSLQERMTLYCELQDLVIEENDLITPDPELIAELDRRMEEYRKDPSTAKPWSEVRARLQARLQSASGE